MAANFFLKLETPNIEGESTDKNHTKEIQILSWSHSFNQPTKPTRTVAIAPPSIETEPQATYTLENSATSRTPIPLC